jgi:hypothetical protein
LIPYGILLLDKVDYAAGSARTVAWTGSAATRSECATGKNGDVHERAPARSITEDRNRFIKTLRQSACLVLLGVWYYTT